MTLRELLDITNDNFIQNSVNVYQVFSTDPRYYHLSDFRVASSVSGPSYLLTRIDPIRENIMKSKEEK